MQMILGLPVDLGRRSRFWSFWDVLPVLASHLVACMCRGSRFVSDVVGNSGNTVASHRCVYVQV
jgi:hypothetical protein